MATSIVPYDQRWEQSFGLERSSYMGFLELYVGATSPEMIIKILSLCKALKLDPMAKPVNIVEIWNSKLKRMIPSLWLSIGGLRTLAHRTGKIAARLPAEFADELADDAEVIVPLWCRCGYKIITGSHVYDSWGPLVYFNEVARRNNKDGTLLSMWKKMPSYMLEKVAEAASLRAVCPEATGGMVSSDEMDPDMSIDDAAIVSVPAVPTQREPGDDTEIESKDGA